MRPGAAGGEPGVRRLELVDAEVGGVPVTCGLPDVRAQPRVRQREKLDAPGDDGVLDVVDAVRHVVGEVHDLRLHAGHPRGNRGPHPVEDRSVVLVHAELAYGPGKSVAVSPSRRRRVGQAPRVLARGVEHRTGQVEPGALPVRGDRLRLEAGDQPQRLGVAFEPADVGRRGVEGGLTVVPERRMTEIVRQTGRLDDIGVAAEGVRQVAADLRNLESVGQPVAA